MAVGRSRRGRSHAGDGPDLEVLDPTTGEALAPPPAVPARETAVAPSGAGRRRRQTSRLLAALAVACALGAGWSGLTISTLRAVERSWAAAVALDEARQNADLAAFSLAHSVGGGERDDEVLRGALDQVGDEVAGRLLVLEDRLRDRWILDRRVDALRDEMVEALRFRRFQLDPSRRDLGETPLRRVEASLARQLRRFRLEPSTERPPALAAAAPAIASLRRYASVETATVLIVAGDRRLVTVDVDASSSSVRLVGAVTELLTSFGLAIVRTDDGFVTAYPLPVDGPPVWTIEGDDVVAGRPGGVGDGGDGVVAWVRTPSGLVAVGTDHRPRPPVAIADDGDLLADTDGGLLVGDGAGALHLHDPATGLRRRTLPLAGRFAGASPGFVAVWADGDRPALVLLRLADDVATGVPIPRAGGGPVVEAPGGGSFAFATAGTGVLRVDGTTWSLVGIGGPRAAVGEGGLTWSPDGRFLFWATPDRRLAFGNEDDQDLLRVPIDDAEQVVAVARRR
ncbi:MAG TPA: hypothetical protein VM933_06445 [Acidimicrobiales bacterium]|nr:hypothetical protein [Acidimicrobiales bacterium]